MNISDLLKSNFLENVTSVSVIDMIIAMVLAFGIGVFIYLVYKKTYKGVMYSSGFGITLIALTMIATFVILAVTSNVVLSLGMVGALSIVRFRTAIKEPLDIAFLFWSIASGIVIAAGMIPLAVFGSVMIGLILLIFVNKKPTDMPYIIVVNCNNREAEAKVKSFIDANVTKSIIKNKTVSKEGIELNIEVRLKDDNTDFINNVVDLEDVNHAVLVSYNGEFMN
ncbi:DUF4956 domain-containing protein [Acetobacterium paludosum]|uniref:DUF4956 domain-containing protein n=1 Tax=Acetobacterium paludosum TaxID=52693 RepID=A0A923HU71_9FIRM|nr:DUF4956 domain-containing protein [Acetobacterium paludosum]MBC3887777.1 DUF4956 domain-containing protein [Acetobacterium paludosum]